MTQVTDRGLRLPAAQGRPPVLATCVLRGVMAAGLGLGALAVLVTVVWISSPYPDSGPSGVLRAVAALWLLAHGTQLVRPDTLSGVPAPVGIVPLLLVGLPVWLAHRAARDALSYEREPEPGYGDDGGAEEGGERTALSPVWTAFTAVTCGYLLVGAAAVLYASDGPLPAAPLSAALHLTLVTSGAVGAGLWTAHGRPRVPLPGWVPGPVRRVLVHRRTNTAVRAGSAGVAVLLAGGALLAGAGLVWHAGAAQDAFLRLAEDWPGRLAVLLLALALVPNAVVWGAAYGLGPGLLLGTGAVATPLGVAGTPAVPHFPLLSALPAEPRGNWLTWSVAVLPVLAGLAVGWWTVRRATGEEAGEGEEAWGRGETALAALCGAAACGAALALLTALSVGPLGSERLAALGPVWWRTGGAALLWTAGVGVPGALGLRWWWGRKAAEPPVSGVVPVAAVPPVSGVVPETVAEAAGVRRWWSRVAWRRRKGEVAESGDREPYDVLPVGAWHDSGVREVRRAALREASGGLMPDAPAGGEVPERPAGAPVVVVPEPGEPGSAVPVDSDGLPGAGDRAEPEPEEREAAVPGDQGEPGPEGSPLPEAEGEPPAPH
ncbi:DUF6350 family protein [Streptomyces sp. NPDC059994]|uniref:cell division protein PerM n=1 Tax=Streptomyces sp. NPDC059994 TaxID=3347029 RepID=UPI003675B87A